jgi:threonine synthase
MDIQVSSNFERALYFAYGQDSDAINGLMADLANGGFDVGDNALRDLKNTYKSGRVSEDETSATIKEFYAATGELLCPHSAIGVRVAQDMRDPATPMITLATAHPAKFPDAVEAATGVRPPLPDHMADLFERDERLTRVPNDLEALKDIIKGGIAQ